MLPPPRLRLIFSSQKELESSEKLSLWDVTRPTPLRPQWPHFGSHWDPSRLGRGRPWPLEVPALAGPTIFSVTVKTLPFVFQTETHILLPLDCRRTVRPLGPAGGARRGDHLLRLRRSGNTKGTCGVTDRVGRLTTLTLSNGLNNSLITLFDVS